MEQIITGEKKSRCQLKEAFGEMEEASMLRDLSSPVTENIRLQLVKDRLVLSLNDFKDAANLKSTWSVKQECP